MKSAIFSAIPLLASFASAAPVEARQATNIDTTVLQFALTLEHLENVFYKQALQKFSEQDFVNAGYSRQYRRNLQFIAHDEEEHVKLLSGAITAAGAAPVQACTYKFPYTDVKSFITLSSVLEGVGTSAYLGGAPLITSKAYLTVAGSILVTEALHTSYQRAAIAEVPFANPYGTPLDPTSVFTLASAFIVQCPKSNAALPFTPFPALSYYPNGAGNREVPSANPSDAIKRNAQQQPAAAPCAGATVIFTSAVTPPAGSYLTFVSGLAVTSVKATIYGHAVSAKIPAVAEGQTYVFLTKRDVETTFDATAVIAGPAILEVNPAEPSINYSQS